VLEEAAVEAEEEQAGEKTMSIKVGVFLFFVGFVLGLLTGLGVL
jgi:hypothetical protein